VVVGQWRIWSADVRGGSRVRIKKKCAKEREGRTSQADDSVIGVESNRGMDERRGGKWNSSSAAETKGQKGGWNK